MINLIRHIPHLAVMAIIVWKSAGCHFSGASVHQLTPEYVNSIWDSAALTEPYDANRYTVYEDKFLQVKHGVSCVNADRAYRDNNAGDPSIGVRIDESIPIPPGYDTATVFLNGWRLRYSSKDHHVMGLSTAIVDIEQDENELRWKAGGVLSDRDGDDGFAWCYNYTTLLWKSQPSRYNRHLDATPADTDESAGLTFLSTDNSNQQTSYKADPNSYGRFENPPAALLPRGFGIIWDANDPWQDTDIDHHLLQFALKYGDSQIITYADGSGSDLWWQFETVFRDKKIHRAYYAAQVVSVLYGDSVDVWRQPTDFDIFPVPPLGHSTGIHEVFSETIVVENIPFDYAVPMLTGWDLGDNQKDIHIQYIGVWIESFDYTKDPNEVTGTLSYTIKSVFHDKGERFSSPGARQPRHQVKILGLTPTGTIVTNPNPTPTTGTINEEPVETPTANTPAKTGTLNENPSDTPTSTWRSSPATGRFGSRALMP